MELLSDKLKIFNKFEIKTKAINQFSNKINYLYRAKPHIVNLSKLENWVQNHPVGESREVANILATIIKTKSRISNEDLEDNLFKLGHKIQDFFQNYKMNTEQEIIIVHMGIDKSARWIYQWMKEINAWPEEMKVSEIIKNNEIENALKRHPEGLFVYVDDASFSGQQIESLYSEFLEEKNIGKYTHANILIAVPYMSSAAINVMVRSGFNNFLYEEILLRVEDLIRQDNSISDPDRIIGIMQKMYKFSTNGYLFYFDHMLPDEASSMTDKGGQLTVLKAAVVIDSNGKRLNSSRMDPSIAFLNEKVSPPYKSKIIPYQISE